PLEVSASLGSGADAVQLPYRGGRMAALVIMPTTEPVSQFSASLTPANLGHLVTALAPTTLDLAMPSLSLHDSHELIPTVRSLGVQDAFEGGRADFTGMTSTPLVVTDIVQKDTLDVSPWGSEASAATGIGMASSARRAATTMTIDHPFLFLIRDTQTGQILFESQVVDPTTG
ncbi:MAG: serpin family protein, partial [Acidimicrobiales bacterium]